MCIWLNCGYLKKNVNDSLMTNVLKNLGEKLNSYSNYLYDLA